MAENGTLTKQQLKAKIRERYKGVDCRTAFSEKQKRRTKRKLKAHGKAGARRQKKTGKRRFPRIGKTKK